MLKNFFLIAVNVFVILSLFLSCSKSDDDANDNTTKETYEIEYRINGLNSNFTEISYTDSNGKPRVFNNISEFMDDSKKTTISSKPFTCRITARVLNETSERMNYSLIIVVDGVVKKIVNANTPAWTLSTSEAEYTYE